MLKVSFLMKIFLIICICLECKITLLIPFLGKSFGGLKVICYFSLFILARLLANKTKSLIKMYRWIDILMIILVLFLTIQIQYSVNSMGRDFKFVFWDGIYTYVKFLCIYSLVYLFEKDSIKKIMKMVLGVVFISIFIQFVVAIIYNKTGIIVLNNLINNKEWVRNNNIRIGSTALVWMTFIFYYVCSQYEIKKFNKIKYIMYCVFILYFVCFINQSRSQYIAIFICLATMILYRRRRRKEIILIGILFLVIPIIIVKSGFWDMLLNIFNNSSPIEIQSTRKILLNKIIPQVLEHPLLGFGLGINTVDLNEIWLFHFVDYGIIGDFIHMGVVPILLYLYTIILNFKNAKALYKIECFEYLFSIGLVTFMIVSCIGFTILDSTRIFALPFVIAIGIFIKKEIIIGKMNGNYIKNYLVE